MEFTINQLNDQWIEAGHVVEDLNNKLNLALNDDNTTEEEFAAMKAERDTAKAKRDAWKEQLDEARAYQITSMKETKPLSASEANLKDKFVSDFKNMITGHFNAVTSGTGDNAGNGGLTIPSDIQTAIHALVRQYASLQNLVTTEHVATNNGSRVYEKFADIRPLAAVSEGEKITDNDDPQLLTIKYVIKEYAGINTVTNDLLADTAENILSWLTTWVARKVVVTRNTAILGVLNTASKKPTVAKFDDIKNMVLTGLDPAIAATASFVTNQSGFAVLAKVKNAMGNYMIQRDVTQPETYLLEGKPVTVVADRWLPDVSGAHPLYFGDFAQAVTLFDRQNMSLASTQDGAGAFETNTTKVRVVDRFDVKQTDGDAYMVGSFTAVADQPANFAATSHNS